MSKWGFISSKLGGVPLKIAKKKIMEESIYKWMISGGTPILGNHQVDILRSNNCLKKTNPPIAFAKQKNENSAVTVTQISRNPRGFNFTSHGTARGDSAAVNGPHGCR